jgi:hypothetical protein
MQNKTITLNNNNIEAIEDAFSLITSTLDDNDNIAKDIEDALNASYNVLNNLLNAINN